MAKNQGQFQKGYSLFELLTEGLTRQANRGIRLVGLHVGLAEPQ
jgi:hypothetical protein